METETQFTWREEFSIGVDIIDREHRRLFQIINKLFHFKEEERDSRWICQEGIKYFKGHAVQHFEDEETYMASIKYEGLERHRSIHNGFREKTLPALEEELVRTDYSTEAMEHFLGVCAGWLVGHTLTEDQAIKEKGASTWENLLPDEELAAMKKIIVHLVFDLFHLEAQAISNAYGGEKFGSGVYHRLVYGRPQDEKKQEILMVFEEKLRVNTVGKVLGLRTNKLDAMLTNAARYTARQFVGRVMEHLPASRDYELLEENLLSYDQFHAVFQRKKPQVSLLFNTGGAGYFSYCVIAPHLLEDGVGTALEPENAMTEVENYLARREQQNTAESKRKILVVDDSATIRQAMKNLLEEDYDVAQAESGVAAIRTITLNRPDLVLLDYEMPVCDGGQTLMMLRSEESFTDIPVFFLTGRGDPQSVKKLLSLKPTGYLLKYLKPAEIKKKIDDFMSQSGAPA